ncbi:MAG: hypothetical protein ABI863_09035 [Ginsengibacter sp.]
MEIRIGLKMSVIIALVLIASYPTSSFSQTAHNYNYDSMPRMVHLGRSSLSFSISPYIVNKARAQPIAGNYHLKTIYANGFEAGLDYHINLSECYSISVGMHGGAAARNYKLFISKNDFNPNLNFDVNENGQLTSEYDFYACMPIWLEKRWFTKSSSFWNVVTGLNVRYYPIRYYGDGVELIYPDVNGNQMTVLEINASFGNNLRPWLNYNIGGGYAILLRNNNYLQGNLMANFSGKKIVNGTYTINVNGKPQSTGTYSANLSYIGLSFSYIFTGANKRMRKLYESRLK